MDAAACPIGKARVKTAKSGREETPLERISRTAENKKFIWE